MYSKREEFDGPAGFKYNKRVDKKMMESSQIKTNYTQTKTIGGHGLIRIPHFRAAGIHENRF